MNTALSIAVVRAFDRRTRSEDRMILPTEFARLQRMSGRTFTLDACCNESGCNRLVDNYCSPARDFLRHDCSGQHVWLNAPFAQLEQFIAHYKQCKQRDPRSTSACILVPVWHGERSQGWRRLLAGMRLLHEYPAGSVLFTGPCAAGTRRYLPPTPWAVQVWHDPPELPLSISAVADAASLTMAFPGRVTDAACSVLIDSGAKGFAYMSSAFAERLALQIDAHGARDYRVADGRTAHTLGTATVSLTIGDSELFLACHVIDMLPEYDIILGDAWLLAHGAYLDYARGACVFRVGRKRVVLKSRSPSSKRMSDLDHNLVLSALEWQQLMNAPSESTDAIEGMHLVLVKPEPTAPVEPPSTSSFRVDPQQLQAVLDEFKSTFVGDLPSGVPDLLLHQEVVQLEPGAKPPVSRIMRHSQLEQQEIEQQVSFLLEKGLIQPSASPFGAPVLFVRKKDGTLRMCIDYRGINRITVKNKYPLPRIDDLLDRLQGAKVFSSLDLCSAYHQVRLVDSDVPKTAFRCHLGSFEYKVLPFGLTNAPSHFQAVINGVLGGFEPDLNGKQVSLRTFVCVYLDDILIFSKTPEEHLHHLRIVLKRLQQHRFYVKLKKCEFDKPEVKFLGHIVSAEGVKPDPAKVKAVLAWPVPKDITELRSFLGLANYFRKFIRGYSQIAAPLTDMFKKWPADNTYSEEALQAFQAVKQALSSAPVLALPDFDKPFEVICDASGVGIGAILLQDKHPVAYESRKLTPAERNYSTTEAELLAVVHAFKVWRCYLEGAKGVTVVTDHCPNTYFSTQSVLSRRQARWSEYLHQFSFKWQYRPGRINAADPLSRYIVLTLASLSEGGSREFSRPEDHHADIERRILLAYESDPWFADSYNLADLTRRKPGYWLRQGRIVVPNADGLRTECLKLCHDMPWAGHPGVTKTLKLLQRFFWWPSMRADVERYVRECHSCQTVKSRNELPHGLLEPLPIPEAPWESMSMDFITALPESVRGHDTIMVVVDRLTKLAHFIPMKETTDALGVAELLREQVFRLHGVPKNIVSDRDVRFTSEFFKSLCGALGIAQHMSTANHPETDGQTERVNRCLEDYLRHYVAPDQRNWEELLCMAEFAYNSAWHESVQNTPFYLTYGYNPSTPLSHLLKHFDTTDGKVLALAALGSAEKPTSRAQKRKALAVMQRVPAVARFTAHMQEALAAAKRALQAARARMKYYADKRRKAVTYVVGDRVMLSSKHVSLKSGGTRKLLPRWLGPFDIVEQINPVAFKLDLREWNTKLHPVFHVSLLRRYHWDGRTDVRPLPLVVDGELEYEVESIIKRYYNRAGKLFYVVRWKGYGPESDTREPPDNLTNCPELLRAFLDAEQRGMVPLPEFASGSKALPAVQGVSVPHAPVSPVRPGRKRAMSVAPAVEPVAKRTRSRVVVPPARLRS